MVTGQSFPKVREHLGTVAGFGCFMSDITAYLSKQGISSKPSKTITTRCILRLSGDAQSHFVLRWDGYTFDPAQGVYANLPNNIAEIVSL